MNINLPQDFKDDMKKLLGKNADKLFAEYDKAPYKGIRVNTLKCKREKIEKFFGENIKSTPFSKEGYYLASDYSGIGSVPLHHAGAFYVQEPSAMSAATLLGAQENDRVLDLCAAPGGKSTQIAAALNGTGLLWSNEIIKSRANTLLSNIERCGVRNAVVSSETPQRLCDKLGGFFDKILVDAPCSGEGMFRKDSAAVNEWSRENVMLCKARQLEILDCAVKALRQGGELVYSTCTFSHEENEEVTEEFLLKHPDFSIVESDVSFGRKTSCGGIRIFPMDGGEGHYAVKFRRLSENPLSASEYDYLPQKNKNAVNDYKSLIEGLEAEILNYKPEFNYSVFGDKILILPDGLPDIKGLNILRAGVAFADIKKNRIEPHHSLFMSLESAFVNNYIDLSSAGEAIKAFLHGEETEISKALSGYVLVAVDGVSTGFGKASNGRLKNKYPKGLRIM